MKKLAYICLALLTFGLMMSCEDYDKNESHFSKTDIPQIFVENWPRPMNVNIGDSIIIAPLVSPSDGATYLWTMIDTLALKENPIDENKIVKLSTNRKLEYKVAVDVGYYLLKIEVDRYGVKNDYKGYVNVRE
ncbi:MAG: hypothetical protein ACLVKO_10625 [Dysgonomonas sp.]